MIKEFIKKHELLSVIFLIVLYVVLNSYCVQSFGAADYRSFIVNFVFSIALIFITVSNRLVEYLGLNSFPHPKEYLYFVPLAIIMSVNLWNGFNINNSDLEIVFCILSMLCVGFIEEIIFRGFLFKIMAKDNEKSAVIVSSLTFGVGHIVNLLNGAALLETLLQICYAAAIGYLFVTIFRKSKSLYPCIIAHSFTNATSVFNIKNILSTYISPIILIIVPILYALYIRKSVKID